MGRRRAPRARLIVLMATGTLALPALPWLAWADPPPAGSACTITGTVGPDTLTGTPGDDVICGLGGDDKIFGLGGDDLIIGGGGDDTIDGGDGLDRVLGHGGDDVLDGGADADEVRGGTGIDTINGSGGGDQLYGGADADNVSGDVGTDLVVGGPGDDQLTGGDDGDVLRGGDGSDTHDGGPGDDKIVDRDGAPFVDDVSCGDGAADVANVDLADTVDPDCELRRNLDREDPVAVNDTRTVQEDAGATTLPVLANDTDADGGPKRIDAVTQPGNGTVVRFNRSVTYTPNANYCNLPPGTTLDTFTYTLAPGASTATVSVKVRCADDAPVAVHDTTTVTEDDPATTIDVLANDTDVDGGPISISSVIQPTDGTVVITNGGADLTYEPDADYCNDSPGHPPDFFFYFLAPGGASTSVYVTVGCVDDAPVAVGDTATVTEDDPATIIDVLANDTDIDGGPISISSVNQPQHGRVVIIEDGAALTYRPNPNYCSSVPTPFFYTLAPGGDLALVTVTVTCVADPASPADDTMSVVEDDPATIIDVLANDDPGDGGPISITSVTQPTNGAVVITNGGADLTYEPDPNYCNLPPGATLDTFAYALSTGASTATVSVAVDCVDDAPVAVDDRKTVAENDAATTIDVLANDTDIDGGPISINSATEPQNGQVVIINGGAALTYRPNADYCNTGNPPDYFFYNLVPGGLPALVSVTVTCAAVPHPPT